MMYQLGRVAQLLLGAFLVALGVAVSVRADLGTAPVASLPTVLSFTSSWSVGTYLMILNLLLISVQIAILRKKFSMFQLLQIPLALAFSVFVDLSMALTWWLEPTNYLMQWVWILVSVVLMALGVIVELRPRLTYLPANAVVFTIYEALQNIPYGTIKVIFDTTIVVVAAIVSFATMGGLYGVREGTVFAMFGVGLVIRIIMALIKRFKGETA